jgi:hypothetical protein
LAKCWNKKNKGAKTQELKKKTEYHCDTLDNKNKINNHNNKNIILNTMSKYIYILLVLFSIINGPAQPLQKKQSKSILILNGTAHLWKK